jgi:hypothetical protein
MLVQLLQNTIPVHLHSEKSIAYLNFEVRDIKFLGKTYFFLKRIILVEQWALLDSHSKEQTPKAANQPRPTPPRRPRLIRRASDTHEAAAAS